MPRLWILTLLGVLLGTCGYAHADGIYTKNSPVLQVSAKTYDSLIAQSNHTSILEFYAPWCGHCQSLKPAYEKAAKNLAGLAKVAAINCDEETNKPLCGQMGVQGFPTLKIIRPGTKPGRPIVEDYQGPRSAKGIVEAVVDKIPNHVKRLQASGLDAWLAGAGTPAKAILFSEKGTTGALIKSLAVDFLGSISVAQIRSKEEAAVERYGITKFPSLVLWLGEGQEPVVYADEMKKDLLVAFLSQAAPPNPDPASKKAKASRSSKDSKSASKASSSEASFSKASEAHRSSDFDDYLGASTIVLDESTPTESPLPMVETDEIPIPTLKALPPIPTLSTPAELDAACLKPKSGTCILVLLPTDSDPEAGLSEIVLQALAGFAEIAAKHGKRRSNIFPFYQLPSENQRANTIRSELGLGATTKPEIIAINNKRGWWRHYSADGYGIKELDNFVDAIVLDESSKQKLPAGFGTQLPVEHGTPAESDPAEPYQPGHNEL